MPACFPIEGTGVCCNHRKFAFGVTGLPSVVVQETLYSHRRHGLGLGYFPVLHPTFATSKMSPLSPFTLFQVAFSELGPSTSTACVPLDITWCARSVMRQASCVLFVVGFVVYLIPTEDRLDWVYTDGSKLGDPPAIGASAVLQSGHVADHMPCATIP